MQVGMQERNHRRDGQYGDTQTNAAEPKQQERGGALPSRWKRISRKSSFAHGKVPADIAAARPIDVEAVTGGCGVSKLN
jgi:hypothetical protein